MAHLRRRPKHLPITARCIYTCELTSCPACGQPLTPCTHYSFTKTVQHLDRVVSVAGRPKQCANPACAAGGVPYPASAAQRHALPKSSYGFDVLAQIGSWHEHEHLNSYQMHARLTPQVQISRREVDLLLSRYLLLRAAAQRRNLAALQQAVARYGGLILSADGLQPEGAQEQLWVVREVLSGSILAVGWLPRVASETVQSLLAPVAAFFAAQHWSLLATVSDKQVPLAAALAALWPEVPHQWCQAHYLRQVAEPLAGQDRALTGDLRAAVRAALGPDVAQVAHAAAQQAGAFSP